MQRSLILYLILAITAICSRSMDFGLRFNSHSFPLDQRTSLSLGDKPIEFNKELLIGFYFNFYTTPLFGTIVSLTTDDGIKISVVASHQGQDAYLLGLVINDRLELMRGLITLDPGREDKIDITLNKTNNTTTLKYNNEETQVPIDLSNTRSAIVIFGIDSSSGLTDVAPIELRNTRIFIDHQNTNWWDFKYHDAPDYKIDELNGMIAKATNPHWLIDDHTDWRLIYNQTVKDNLQTAFDPKTERFFIVGNDNIKEWWPLTADSIEHSVNSGFRPLAFSNHILYDTVADKLVNYNLTHQCMASFNFSNGQWETSGKISPSEEANYANHAFTIDGSTAYTFGGYGFYKFHNDLFNVDLTGNSIRECKLQPELPPTTSAAAAIVDGKLYLFGGKGNSSGRQELPSKCHYAMYAYDINTWQGEQIWKIDTVAHDFLPSQTMYYDLADDCFYAASTCNGGEMIKIARNKPEINVVSTNINSKMEYHDFVFDLFRSKDGKRYYLLIDKRLDQYTHDYSIYTISAPFIEDPEIIAKKSLSSSVSSKKNSDFSWLLLATAMLAAGLGLWIYFRRRKSAGKSSESELQPVSDMVHDNDNDNNNGNEASLCEQITEAGSHGNDGLLFFDKKDNASAEPSFDRSSSAISLLGAFNVRAKNGEDITNKFTDRLKSLLILLLLTNSRSENGIKYQTIDEEIWGDKDEKSAQNNRNVYMRKLRLLLEEVGDVPVTYDKGYFKINCSNVMYDYGEALARIAELQTNSNTSPELINETLDLLLMGPLLPMTTYDWLDQYKADYSDRALEILNKLLRYEFNRNDELSFKIAHTISRHEPLSEEAMKAKCILLSKKKMVGQAKNVYAKFCKEYLTSLGEEYKTSFPDICRSQL